MRIVRNENEIKSAIGALQRENPAAKTGFVPTMGALHEGHMSLINLARSECEIVICSIFVNPTQFNNPDDLKTYPRTIEADSAMLEAHNCDILLLPEFEDVYPNGVQPYAIELDGLDLQMEGAFRPGHFDGVCMVVERFLTMVKPDRAYFGKKDFQQLAIIKKMAAIRQLPVTIVGAPISRTAHGLARSSRNQLLTEKQREDATVIYRALRSAIAFSFDNTRTASVQQHIHGFFETYDMEVEYVAIVDNATLQHVDTIVPGETSVCIAVYCGPVRLIDNMQF